MGSTKCDATLWLLPVTLAADAPVADVLPALNLEVMSRLRHFAVENVRTARRFLRRAIAGFDIDGSTFAVLDKNTPAGELPAIAAPLLEGHDMGLMSEAGCPGVADPGALLVDFAQRRGLRVSPLVGPSSILMSLMASGLNGQHFTFAGYLPIDAGARAARLKAMVHEARGGVTQIFIETPYRNARLLKELAAALPGDMPLCVAADITGSRQSILTLPAARWAGRDADAYNKVPAIFLFGRSASTL